MKVIFRNHVNWTRVKRLSSHFHSSLFHLYSSPIHVSEPCCSSLVSFLSLRFKCLLLTCCRWSWISSVRCKWSFLWSKDSAGVIFFFFTNQPRVRARGTPGHGHSQGRAQDLIYLRKGMLRLICTLESVDDEMPFGVWWEKKSKRFEVFWDVF